MSTPAFKLLDVEKKYMVPQPASSFWEKRKFKPLAALDGIRLSVDFGDSVALVGESGSGKSTLLRVLLGLTAASNGRALYRNQPIAEMKTEARGQFRREVAMIYQDARGSLNPRMTVRNLIAEPLLRHELCAAPDVDGMVAGLLEKVGLPGEIARRYPAQMSGGQVRRVAIARALAAQPRILVADEAVSGLDVSTQAQLLALLSDLRREMNLTLLFITHDLGVARYLCDRIAVMYLGRIVEAGPTREVLTNPAHPYTRALRDAAPKFFGPLPAPLSGEIPSPINLPPGCRFAGRCPIATDACAARDPALTRYGTDREVACIRPLS